MPLRYAAAFISRCLRFSSFFLLSFSPAPCAIELIGAAFRRRYADEVLLAWFHFRRADDRRCSRHDAMLLDTGFFTSLIIFFADVADDYFIFLHDYFSCCR